MSLYNRYLEEKLRTNSIVKNYWKCYYFIFSHGSSRNDMVKAFCRKNGKPFKQIKISNREEDDL